MGVEAGAVHGHRVLKVANPLRLLCHYGKQGPSSLAIALAVPLLSPLVAPFKYLTSLPWLGAPVATVDMSANRIEESASSCVARCPKINNYINWLAIS